MFVSNRHCVELCWLTEKLLANVVRTCRCPFRHQLLRHHPFMDEFLQWSGLSIAFNLHANQKRNAQKHRNNKKHHHDDDGNADNKQSLRLVGRERQYPRPTPSHVMCTQSVESHMCASAKKKRHRPHPTPSHVMCAQRVESYMCARAKKRHHPNMCASETERHDVCPKCRISHVRKCKKTSASPHHAIPCDVCPKCRVSHVCKCKRTSSPPPTPIPCDVCPNCRISHVCKCKKNVMTSTQPHPMPCGLCPK